MLYKAFDGFLERETWHTRHATDMAAFYRALDTVVRQPHFNPESVGDYFRQQKDVVDREEHPFSNVIDRYVNDAWAVKEYLDATGRLHEYVPEPNS